MKFINFQLRAWAAEDQKHVYVIVHSSPAGAMRRPEKVPFEVGQLEEIRQITEKQWLGGEGTLAQVIEAGQLLAQALLPPVVLDLLNRSIGRIGEDGLRLRLCLDDTLMDAPWEYIYRPGASKEEGANGFLVLERHLSVVREPPVGYAAIEPSDLQQRMVVIGAYQSDGGDPWDIKLERRLLADALKPVEEFFYIDEAFDAAHDLQIEQSLRGPTAIFHYSGHVDVSGKDAKLVREITRWPLDNVWDASNCDLIEGDKKLGRLLQRAGTRLAVFSACNSGRWLFVKPLLEEGLPALIGVHSSTASIAAIAFFQSLYSSLAVGLSLDEAVMYARLRLLDEGVTLGTESCEWGAFTVYMPTAEAVLFPKPDEQPQIKEQQQLIRREAKQLESKRALRIAITAAFEEEELDTLCSDLEEELRNDGKDYEVDLELVGGEMKETKVQKLIEYLERRDCLSYLREAVQRERPDLRL